MNSIPESVGKLEAWYRTRIRNEDDSVTEFLWDPLSAKVCSRNELGLNEETGLDTGKAGSRFYTFDGLETER